jgi:hypothetical protein
MVQPLPAIRGRVAHPLVPVWETRPLDVSGLRQATGAKCRAEHRPVECLGAAQACM